jgi:hypothetical protein
VILVSDWSMLLSQHSLARRLLCPLFPTDSADSHLLDRIDRNTESIAQFSRQVLITQSLIPVFASFSTQFAESKNWLYSQAGMDCYHPCKWDHLVGRSSVVAFFLVCPVLTACLWNIWAYLKSALRRYSGPFFARKSHSSPLPFPLA